MKLGSVIKKAQQLLEIEGVSIVEIHRRPYEGQRFEYWAHVREPHTLIECRADGEEYEKPIFVSDFSYSYMVVY